MIAVWKHYADSDNAVGEDEYMRSRAWRFDMKALCKTLFLVLASVLLASCGGGGGGSNSAFEPVSFVVTVTPASSTITTNAFTSVVVTVKTNDGQAAQDGTVVNLALTPATIGTVSGAAGSASGATATNTLSGGTASFIYNSTDQAGTAHLVASVTLSGTSGSSGTDTGAADVTVNAGNSQDPRLQLTTASTTLPLNPFAGESEVSPFPGNYIGSPYIAEVTVTWRHSNGQLVAGTLPVNVSINPVTFASFSTLDDPSTTWTGQTDTPPDAKGNEFLTLLGSGPVNVTGGNGVIFVHAEDVPGTSVLTVTAVDPDSGQTISSQLAFTVAGSASGSLPESITAQADGGAYVTDDGGISTVVRATVLTGDGVGVANPSGFDNVQFTIAGPSGTDARLTGINAAGQSVTGTTVNTGTHNGVASVTFVPGTVTGATQVKATADRGDNNVDNQIQDPISATATVTVSDGKLDSITIDSPDAASLGVSSAVTEDPPGSGNYEIAITAKGVDREGNPVLPGTQLVFGDIDSPQTPNAGSPQTWFLISGSHGDPQEGGRLFTATDGKFTTAGGGAGPGDTLLVVGKASEGAPQGNDDLESATKITAINSATSLNVATQFNLNDPTGVSVDNGAVLPYLIGRAEFSAVESPSFTDIQTSTLTGEAITVLSYPASQLGKAVAVWAQGTGTDESGADRTKIITDLVAFTLPGIATGAILSASPDPLLGNTTNELVTVCYYDGTNRPIPNFGISFSFDLGGTGTGTGTGSVDGVSTSGLLKNRTGANGCATANVTTSGLGVGTTATITFSAGPMDVAQTTVTVPFVVNEGALQVSPCQFKGSASPQTIAIKAVDGGGNPLPDQQVTAACTVLTGTGSITSTSPLATDQSGVTYAVITVAPNDDTSVVGYCTYTSGTLIESVGVNTGSCSTTGGGGGFSPEP
jgi:hypothetical protein